MKKKDIIDLRGKSVKELVKMVSAKKEEAKKAGMEANSGKGKNLKAAKNARRVVAQILTIVKEKEIIEKLEAKKEPEAKKKE